MKETISVIIPSYNAGQYLKPAVESVLAQREPAVEILVVDDGSTDGSMDSIKDLPIRILAKMNGGEASARNLGIISTKARYITFLDGDDLLATGSLHVRFRFLEQNPHEWAVGGLPSKLIGEDGSCLSNVYQKMSKARPEPFRLALEGYQAGPFFPVCCSLYLYRREVFEKVGFYDESFFTASDCDFHYRLLSKTSVPMLSAPIFDRRIHRNNISLVAQGRERFGFTPVVDDIVRRVNSRFGIPSDRLSPWENDYLPSTHGS